MRLGDSAYLRQPFYWPFFVGLRIHSILGAQESAEQQNIAFLVPPGPHGCNFSSAH